MNVRRGGWVGYLVLALILGTLGGCGDTEKPEPGAGKREPAPVAQPESVPAAEPEEVYPLVLTFGLDVNAAKAQGRIEESVDAKEVMRDTLAIVRERMRNHRIDGEVGETGRADRFVLRLPDLSEAEQADVVHVLTQVGDLRFRIEVKPDEDYRSARSADHRDPPKRTGVWVKRDRASFDAFKEKEIALWRAAREKGEACVPSDARYALARAAGTEGKVAEDFHLLEEANFPGGVRFDGSILMNPVVSHGMHGNPVVIFDVRAEFQTAFGEWTGANVGLPMAIILNGEWHSAPVIQDKLTRNVQISLGGKGRRDEREREAKALATVLQTGALKVAPVLLSTERR